MSARNLPAGIPVPNKTLATAISAILAGTGTAYAQEGATLEEVVVTATKRAANIQDIPQSIQAFTPEDLKKGGFIGLDDYIRFVPNMTYTTLAPGASKIVFRGVGDAAFTDSTASSAAVYLDEQPITFGSHHPEVRMVDIERVEVLTGPQGTLYGDSSQSGTLRVITNKPDPTRFEGVGDVMLRGGSDSAASYEVSGVLNLPVVEEKFAIRLVGFTARDGGYIDNVLGTTPRFGLSDNAPFVGEDVNDIDTVGGRAAARWFINDEWTATFSTLYQKNDSDYGFTEVDPTSGDLSFTRFSEEPREDEFSQFALTLEGDLGFAELTSVTSYFDRDTKYTRDNSTYTAYFTTFCYYYNGVPGGTIFAPAYCFAPTVYENDPASNVFRTWGNKRLTQEIRLQHQGSRLEWLAGLFFETREETWDYKAFLPGYSNSIAADYWTALYGPLSPDTNDVWWNSNSDTQWDQYAIFGEATFHFNDKFSATVGGRFYDSSFDKTYFVERPNERLDISRGPSDAVVPGVSQPTGDDDGFLPKVSVRYNIDDDKMVYALYSEGFRAGGTNRDRGEVANPALGITGCSTAPRVFDSDILENLEVGAKTRWADGKVQFNLTAYHMTWDDYQFEFINPGWRIFMSTGADGVPGTGDDQSCPFQVSVDNPGDAVVDGIEASVDALAGEQWQLGFNVAAINAETDGPIDFCFRVDQFSSDPALRAECESFIPTVPDGSPLPFSPDLKYSAYAQYDWEVAGMAAYLRAQYSFTDSSLNQVEAAGPDTPSPQVESPDYAIADLSFGLNTDSWDARVFINNVTDERAQLFADTFFFDSFWGRSRVGMNRPREYGVRFTYRWE